MRYIEFRERDAGPVKCRVSVGDMTGLSAAVAATHIIRTAMGFFAVDRPGTLILAKQGDDDDAA